MRRRYEENAQTAVVVIVVILFFVVAGGGVWDLCFVLGGAKGGTEGRLYRRMVAR